MAPKTNDQSPIKPEAVATRACSQRVADCLYDFSLRAAPTSAGLRLTKATKPGWQNYPCQVNRPGTVGLSAALGPIASRFGKPGFRIQFSMDRRWTPHRKLTGMTWGIRPEELPLVVDRGLIEELEARGLKVAFVTQEGGVAALLPVKTAENVRLLLRRVIPERTPLMTPPWLDAPSGVSEGPGSLVSPKMCETLEGRTGLQWLDSWKSIDCSISDKERHRIIIQARDRNYFNQGHLASILPCVQRNHCDPALRIDSLSYELALRYRSRVAAQRQLCSILRGMLHHFMSQHEFLPVRKAAEVYGCKKTLAAEAIRILRLQGILELIQPAVWDVATQKGQAACYRLALSENQIQADGAACLNTVHTETQARLASALVVMNAHTVCGADRECAAHDSSFGGNQESRHITGIDNDCVRVLLSTPFYHNNFSRPNDPSATPPEASSAVPVPRSFSPGIHFPLGWPPGYKRLDESEADTDDRGE